MTSDVYNPLDKENLGRSVADALLMNPLKRLLDITPFEGSGIYAIYTTTQAAPYELLAKLDYGSFNYPPVYVGKAIPEGGRKGVTGPEAKAGRSLYNRLRKHSQSLGDASNLNPSEFWCRYLVVDDIWIPLGESLLINRFSPVWNVVLDGFGNNDPGKGRYSGLRPRWDVLHPGRSWAKKCQPRPESPELLSAEVRKHLELYA